MYGHKGSLNKCFGKKFTGLNRIIYFASVPHEKAHLNPAWSKYLKGHSWWWSAGQISGSWCLAGFCGRRCDASFLPTGTQMDQASDLTHTPKNYC